ncbi:hypothetical protein [Paraflavitalea speifideaquila]|uniref:hypothetical protein n=1 Tax=Paraflavitalea speifideaquila TaxID=3076558 RepID=UPI0028EEE85D|nr:hypothetical protein [Paraflavitalea speifideiaquila]
MQQYRKETEEYLRKVGWFRGMTAEWDYDSLARVLEMYADEVKLEQAGPKWVKATDRLPAEGHYSIKYEGQPMGAYCRPDDIGGSYFSTPDKIVYDGSFYKIEWLDESGAQPAIEATPLERAPTDAYKFCNHHHELTPDYEIVNFGDGDFVANKAAIPC